MNTFDNTQPWGTYSPSMQSLPLRLLVWLGLGRGLVCRWIRKTWIRNFRTIVDAEIDGIKYRLDVAHNTTDSKLLTSSKQYDGTELKHLAAACGKHNSVFVDAGANTGHYSLTLAKLGCSTILAIEPNPPTLNLLRFNVETNGFSTRIIIEPVCLGDTGKVQLYCDGGLGGASIIRNDSPQESVWVDSYPLLDLVTKHHLEKIDAMKIDIEGAEDLALAPFFQSAPRRLWPGTVVIEHCHQDVWKTNVIDLMKQLGYQIKSKTRGNLIMQLG
jgi:FkbM family methyltransferase